MRIRTQLKLNFEYLFSEIIIIGFIIIFIDSCNSLSNCFFVWDMLNDEFGEIIVDFILSIVLREKSTNSLSLGYFFFVSELNFLYSFSMSFIKNKSSSIFFDNINKNFF